MDDEELPQKSGHEIPESFLDRLSDFTGGGFILAFPNAEGETVIMNSISHITISKGVRGMLKDYLEHMEDEEKMNNFGDFIGISVDLDDVDIDDEISE